MPEPGMQHRGALRRGVWLALFTLVLQLSLPLSHFCSLDAESHTCRSDRVNDSCRTDLPPGQSSLQEAPPLAPASSHDHSTCPTCRSLQRPIVAELPPSQPRPEARLAAKKPLICYHIPFSGEPEWDTSSPRGPPRSL